MNPFRMKSGSSPVKEMSNFNIGIVHASLYLRCGRRDGSDDELRSIADIIHSCETREELLYSRRWHTSLRNKAEDRRRNYAPIHLPRTKRAAGRDPLAHPLLTPSLATLASIHFYN